MFQRRIEPPPTPTHVSNPQLWEELRYIRTKVDALEGKVLVLFGTITAISVAITVFELLQGRVP